MSTRFPFAKLLAGSLDYYALKTQSLLLIMAVTQLLNELTEFFSNIFYIHVATSL